MHSYLQELQGRMKLPKSWWASNNVGAQSAPLVYVLNCQNMGGQLPALPIHLGFVFLELQGTCR